MRAKYSPPPSCVSIELALPCPEQPTHSRALHRPADPTAERLCNCPTTETGGGIRRIAKVQRGVHHHISASHLTRTAELHTPPPPTAHCTRLHTSHDQRQIKHPPSGHQLVSSFSSEPLLSSFPHSLRSSAPFLLCFPPDPDPLDSPHSPAPPARPLASMCPVLVMPPAPSVPLYRCSSSTSATSSARVLTNHNAHDLAASLRPPPPPPPMSRNQPTNTLSHCFSLS